MSTIDDLKKQRDALDAKIAAETARTAGMTLEQRLADVLHRKLCHWNHIDECGWQYETNWDHGTHNRYLLRARKILNSRVLLDAISNPSNFQFVENVEKLIDMMNG